MSTHLTYQPKCIYGWRLLFWRTSLNARNSFIQAEKDRDCPLLMVLRKPQVLGSSMLWKVWEGVQHRLHCILLGCGQHILQHLSCCMCWRRFLATLGLFWKCLRESRKKYVRTGEVYLSFSPYGYSARDVGWDLLRLNGARTLVSKAGCSLLKARLWHGCEQKRIAFLLRAVHSGLAVIVFLWRRAWFPLSPSQSHTAGLGLVWEGVWLLEMNGSLNARNLFVLNVSSLHLIKAKVCCHLPRYKARVSLWIYTSTTDGRLWSITLNWWLHRNSCSNLLRASWAWCKKKVYLCRNPNSSYVSAWLHSTHRADVQREMPRSHSRLVIP